MGFGTWIKRSKILYKTSSKYNDEIIVYEDKNGTRKVFCGGIVQSISYDSDKVQRLLWGRAMQYIEQNAIVPVNVLILGFCAGTFAHLLSKRFVNVKITGVEIDKEMISIGGKYFKTNEISDLTIEISDAYSYMKKNKDKYDLIMVDTYYGAMFPATLASTEFIEYITKGLADNGICIINMLNTSDSKAVAENYEKYMRRVFPVVDKVNVSGMTSSDNVLIIGKLV